MEPVQVHQIADWSKGKVHQGLPYRRLVGVSTDSRTVEREECFVALRGEHFDGHDFVGEALAKGAGAVVVDARGQTAVQGASADVAVIVVDDTTRALAAIARGYRRQFSVPVVAVTGSNGKTSTKDLIRAILQRVGPVAATKMNHNNEIGVPLTLFQLEHQHRAAVVELGMRGLGEIDYLAQTVLPTVGVVTNVGPVHVERLGSIENVARAKAELVAALPGNGWAVLNGDDSLVMQMAQTSSAAVRTFGFGNHCDARAVNIELNGLQGSRFDLLYENVRLPVKLRAPGKHYVQNALAAALVGFLLEVPPAEIAQGLLEFEPGQMRLHVTRHADGITLINDAYNASPLSVAAALEVLAQTDGTRRVAVLGDMLELGHIALEAHHSIGEQAVHSGVTFVVAVGQFADAIAAGARRAGLAPNQIITVPDATATAKGIGDWIQPGDVILVKGSRGVRLERVVEAIAARKESGDS